jgi:hypothetical protein
VAAAVVVNLLAAHQVLEAAALVFWVKEPTAEAAVPTTQGQADQVDQPALATAAIMAAVAQVEKTIHLVQEDLVLREQYEFYGAMAEPGHQHSQLTFK